MQVRDLLLAQEPGEAALCVVEKRLTTREREVPEAALRLQSEADLLAALGGGPTPRLVGRGTDPDGPYFLMERIPFPTIAARLEQETLGAAFAARATVAAFTALAALHEAVDARGPLAIVHADLSPANVIVDDAAARAWLLDLELACARESPPRDGAFRGTVRYCAPEVAREEPPTVQSDLFALAATMLHLATGVVPRDAPSLPALLALAAETPLDLAGKSIPAALVKCLAHDPRDRYATARAVLAALC